MNVYKFLKETHKEMLIAELKRQWEEIRRDIHSVKSLRAECKRVQSEVLARMKVIGKLNKQLKELA